jgi:L-glyceraldehyde 3-phosphate reductase
VAALQRLDFSARELAAIDVQAKEGGINLWEGSSNG